MLGFEGFEDTLTVQNVVEFHNDGTIINYGRIPNEQEFQDALTGYTIEATYQELAAQGFSKEQDDQMFYDTYGYGVDAYMTEVVKAMDFSALTSVNITGVYYVSDGKIFTAPSWSSEMDASEFTVDGDTMTLMEGFWDDDAESTILKREPKA